MADELLLAFAMMPATCFDLAAPAPPQVPQLLPTVPVEQAAQGFRFLVQELEADQELAAEQELERPDPGIPQELPGLNQAVPPLAVALFTPEPPRVAQDAPETSPGPRGPSPVTGQDVMDRGSRIPAEVIPAQLVEPLAAGATPPPGVPHTESRQTTTPEPAPTPNPGPEHARAAAPVDPSVPPPAGPPLPPREDPHPKRTQVVISEPSSFGEAGLTRRIGPVEPLQQPQRVLRVMLAGRERQLEPQSLRDTATRRSRFEESVGQLLGHPVGRAIETDTSNPPMGTAEDSSPAEFVRSPATPETRLEQDPMRVQEASLILEPVAPPEVRDKAADPGIPLFAGRPEPQGPPSAQPTTEQPVRTSAPPEPPKEPAGQQPVRHFRFSAGLGEDRVEIDIRDRSGEVQVDLRSSNDLHDRLRSGLESVLERLDHRSSYEAESADRASLRRDVPDGGTSGRHTGSGSDDSQRRQRRPQHGAAVPPRRHPEAAFSQQVQEVIHDS